MTMDALLIAGGLLAAVAQSVLVWLLGGEIKGLIGDSLARWVKKAAERLPPELRDDQEDEWLAELGELRDRPIRALRFVRGLRMAARGITEGLEPELAELAERRIAGDVKTSKESWIAAQEFEFAASARDIERSLQHGHFSPTEAVTALRELQDAYEKQQRKVRLTVTLTLPRRRSDRRPW